MNGPVLPLDSFMEQAYNAVVLRNFAVGVLGYDVQQYDSHFMKQSRQLVISRLKTQARPNTAGFNPYGAKKFDPFDLATFVTNARAEISSFLADVEDPNAPAGQNPGKPFRNGSVTQRPN